MKIKSICFLAGEYPSPDRPNAAVFYQQLVHQFARMGIECKVIHPYPINYRKSTYQKKRVENIDNSYYVEVYRPKTITLGSSKIGSLSAAYMTSNFYINSAKKVLKQLNWKPDIIYGHFISPAGVMAAKLSKETGIPAFIAYGESQPWSIMSIGSKRLSKVLSNVKGFIAVSSKNKNELLTHNITNEEKIMVFPNAVDKRKFYKRDKKDARNLMGWDKDKFIVSFVGHYNHRKGVLRLDKAISKLSDVYVAYAGDGELIPNNKNIIHKGSISPNLMPWFLSASDVFVLPTLHEGCSNAIIEAMACGLPIISSDRDFNYDILNKENAILIDPMNVDEITKAISIVKNNNQLRKELSSKSIITASKLTIENRAKNILKWMELIVNQ